MAVFTVTDDIFRTPQAQDYFNRADRRVMIGLRAALELLGIPVPDYAVRKPPGRPPAEALAAAYDADHGVTRQGPTFQPNTEDRHTAAVRKAKARIARRTGHNGIQP
jgi:hypothetical protein